MAPVFPIPFQILSPWQTDQLSVPFSLAENPLFNIIIRCWNWFFIGWKIFICPGIAFKINVLNFQSLLWMFSLFFCFFNMFFFVHQKLVLPKMMYGMCILYGIMGTDRFHNAFQALIIQFCYLIVVSRKQKHQAHYHSLFSTHLVMEFGVRYEFGNYWSRFQSGFNTNMITSYVVGYGRIDEEWNVQK